MNAAGRPAGGSTLSSPAESSRFSRDWLILGLCLTALLLALSISGATDRADNLVYDWTLRGNPRPAPDNILVVAIDDRSLNELGVWPWPRSTHVAVLKQLAAAHPRAVIYDVLFLTPGLPKVEDEQLGAAFHTLPNVFTPMLFNTPGDNGRAYDPLPPIEPVRSGATIGQALISPDDDGVVRRLSLALDGERRWSHITALAAASDPVGRQAVQALPHFVRRSVALPLRRRGEVLVAFGGPPGRFRTVPFVNVMRGEVPPGLLRDKYILVGATAQGLGDLFSTPVGGENGVMSGVEIQASLLETLLTHRTATEASLPLRIAGGLIALWLLMLGLLRLRPNGAALLGLSLMALVLASTAVLLAGRVWSPPMSTLITLALAVPLWSWRRLSGVSAYMIEELSRLETEPDLEMVASRPATLGRDRVANQVDLMRATVARVRGLRRLVSAAVQSLPDPTVLVALDGHISLADVAAVELFGRRPIPTPADIERFFAAEGGPPFGPQSFEAPDKPWCGERKGADGSIRDILHVPWMDETGAPLGWVVRFGDLTALRRAETAREEALQVLTHDMRSPQASILALLDDSQASSMDEKLKTRVSHYAKRTIALADGFLRLARADAGVYPREPVDLADAMTEAADDAWATSSAQGVRVVAPDYVEDMLVQGNRALLIRVFINLIDNAVKFSPSGSTIACTIGRATTDDGAARVVCAVTDQGQGMPPEVVSSLFQRFSHHGSGRAGPVDGVGLGLAFVRSVVVGHGGTIVCRSEVGVGTTFEIDLPALD